MKKRDRLGLTIRSRVLKVATWYLTMFLGVQTLGSFQDAFNSKEIKQYEEIVEDFGEFLSSNGVEDPIQVFDYYNYALWGGYLSKDHSFQFNTNRDLFFSSYGLGCILGDCVCLNNAGMLKDLYESMGLDSNIVICYVPIKDIQIDYIRGQDTFERKVVKESIDDNSNLPVIVNPATLILGNHVITKVKYNGEYFYYDPTNLAYLSKSDFNDLAIINGEGSFKIKNISIFIFEVDSILKGLFDTNQGDYDLEYLEDVELTDIDVQKLEEFYQQEKELIDSVYDSLTNKSQLAIRNISIVLSCFLLSTAAILGDKIIKSKRVKNENKLKYLISLFMKENGIEKFEDVCNYLYYLIKLGCLSSDEENLKIKKRVCFASSDFVTFDKDKYGKQFFHEYMKSNFDKFEEILVREEECGFFDTFYVFRSTDGYKFYSFKDNLMYTINDYYQLVGPNGEYKIFKLNKKKYLESAPIDESDVSFTKIDEFYNKNKDSIEEIAKTYTYVPKK